MTILDNLRERLAWHRARKLVRKRAPRIWQTSPAERRVLVVLPATERHARPAWRFVESLDLDPRRTLPVVPSGEIAFAPMSYLGKVKPLEADDLDRTGLPRKEFLRDIWQFKPDVALCLTTPFDLAYALLVGASPAAFRAGLSDEGGEPFFDLMVTSTGDYEGALQLLASTIVRVNPPVLAPSSAPAAAGRSVW